MFLDVEVCSKVTAPMWLAILAPAYVPPRGSRGSPQGAFPTSQLFAYTYKQDVRNKVLPRWHGCTAFKNSSYDRTRKFAILIESTYQPRDTQEEMLEYRCVLREIAAGLTHVPVWCQRLLYHNHNFQGFKFARYYLGAEVSDWLTTKYLSPNICNQF